MIERDEFPDPLRTERRADGVKILLHPFSFRSARLGMTITVPAGFPTDGATVPRWPIVYWFFGGRAEEPAAIHDWIYRQQNLTRAIGDVLFRDGMRVCHPPESILRQWGMWIGVRFFGWFFWWWNRKLGPWTSEHDAASSDVEFSSKCG